MEHDDNELLRAAADGDRGAFSGLVERHQRAVVHFVQRFLTLRDISLAEDLAQDVFLSAWKGARGFRGDCEVLTWLLRITTNTCLNYRRSARLRRAVSLDDENISAPTGYDCDGPQNRIAARERSDSVAKAVSGLPANQRAAVLLRHFHGLSYAVIADVLGVSASSVESLLFRARRKLGKELAGQDEAAPQVFSGKGVGEYGVDVSR